jgi:uncharacterized protein (TIGR03083 family)
MTLESSYYLERIAEDSAALAEAARKDLEAPVPSCPDWKMGDLVHHTGWVHRHKTWIVRDLRTDNSGWSHDREPSEDELIEWFEAGAQELLSVLGAADPSARAWNWSHEPDVVAFWPRRMAHETSVHRWDAQAAIGAPAPIDSDLAADGVDEFLYVFVPASPGEAHEQSGAQPEGSVHLHRTDGDGEWFISAGDGAIAVTKEHAKGDVAVRGSASDLVLMLWRRIPPDGLESFGARSVLDGFLAWTDLT